MTSKSCLLIALLVTSLAAQAETIVPLSIGATTILFPKQSGYVALSSASPSAFLLAAAAIPATNQLIESFITKSDLNRIRAGTSLTDRYYQIQVSRKLAPLEINMNQWNAAQPSIMAAMSKLDLSTLLANERNGASTRISDLSHEPASVQFGRIDSPTVYRETPASVRFDMRVPVSIKVGDIQNARIMLGAAAIVLLHNKMIYVYLFGRLDKGNTFTSLNKQLDATVDKMIKINPNRAL